MGLPRAQEDAVLKRAQEWVMETSPTQNLLSLEVGVTRSEAGDISGTRYGFYPVVGWGWEGPAGRR